MVHEHIAYVDIHADYILQELHMPEGTKIVKIVGTPDPDVFRFLVEHESLPSREVGADIPQTLFVAINDHGTIRSNFQDTLKY
jgi:hypothetical protein